MAIRKLTEIISLPKRDCIYDILRHIDLGLCVDIGAAAGHVTRQIRLAGGRDTRVIAFEPFPGNHQFFYDATNDLDNITLIQKAVSNSIGIAEFIVPSVVHGSEPDWQKYAGYSSVGYLSSKTNNVFVQNVKRITKIAIDTLLMRPLSQKMHVNTTTLNVEFHEKVIDFMKIDVQGAEANVLKGAEELLCRNAIHILYIEWTGEREVVEILANNGYQVYDSSYIIGYKKRDIQPFREIGFDIIDEVNLSTGKTAFEMILTDGNISPIAAISEVKKRGLGWIQTDLIAVSQSKLQSFLRAVKMYEDKLVCR